jgi:anti-anti-sigma factor
LILQPTSGLITASMEFKETKTGDFLVIDLIGQLKSSQHNELQNLLLAILGRGEKNIVLNCSGLTYITSSGLRIFLLALKKITAMSGHLRIAGLRDNIREILVIAGFTSIFNIYTTLDEALND